MTSPDVRRESGFSLLELLVAMAIMMLISGAAITALLKMTSTQATIWNRTQMHSGIRGATEVLQQEVGQAGRITLPAAVTTTGVVASCGTANCTTTVNVTSTDGMFEGEQLVIGAGGTQETVVIDAGGVLSGTSIRVKSTQNNATVVGNPATSVPVQVFGAFSAGVVPPATAPSAYAPNVPAMTFTDGSTGHTLKMFGDINGDGKMVYNEYSISPSCICTNTCSPASTTGNLYRNSMDWNAAAPSPGPTPSQILLSNLTANPDGSPCFTYQVARVSINGVMTYFVTDVAVTLTVQTQQLDPVTKQAQKETKALLNVSPRNVFNAWQLAGASVYERVQTMPNQVRLLLP